MKPLTEAQLMGFRGAMVPPTRRKYHIDAPPHPPNRRGWPATKPPPAAPSRSITKRKP